MIYLIVLSRKKVKLVVTQVTQTNIPAVEKVTYSKDTQTAQSGPDHRDCKSIIHLTLSKCKKAS